jgi:hypothetical protein
MKRGDGKAIAVLVDDNFRLVSTSSGTKLVMPNSLTNDMVKQAHEAPKQFLRIGARPLTVANEERVGMVSSARLSVETGPCTRYSDRNALTTGGGLFLSRRVHYVQDVYFRYLSRLGGGGLRPVSDNMPDMFP